MSLKEMKINICGTIIKLVPPVECSSEKELRVALESSYGDDVSHFLEEYLNKRNSSFVWSEDAQNLTEEERKEIFNRLYNTRTLY